MSTRARAGFMWCSFHLWVQLWCWWCCDAGDAGDENSFCFVGLSPVATGMTHEKQKLDWRENCQSYVCPLVSNLEARNGAPQVQLPEVYFDKELLSLMLHIWRCFSLILPSWHGVFKALWSTLSFPPVTTGENLNGSRILILRLFSGCTHNPQ